MTTEGIYIYLGLKNKSELEVSAERATGYKGKKNKPGEWKITDLLEQSRDSCWL